MLVSHFNAFSYNGWVIVYLDFPSRHQGHIQHKVKTNLLSIKFLVLVDVCHRVREFLKPDGGKRFFENSMVRRNFDQFFFEKFFISF
jgi:hypothetical protein